VDEHLGESGEVAEEDGGNVRFWQCQTGIHLCLLFWGRMNTEIHKKYQGNTDRIDGQDTGIDFPEEDKDANEVQQVHGTGKQGRCRVDGDGQEIANGEPGVQRREKKLKG